jgi:hypothetical protein
LHCRHTILLVGDTLSRCAEPVNNRRLAREDMFCRASLPETERCWSAEHRPDAARRWNLLADWTLDVSATSIINGDLKRHDQTAR